MAYCEIKMVGNPCHDSEREEILKALNDAFGNKDINILVAENVTLNPRLGNIDFIIALSLHRGRHNSYLVRNNWLDSAIFIVQLCDNSFYENNIPNAFQTRRSYCNFYKEEMQKAINEVYNLSSNIPIFLWNNEQTKQNEEYDSILCGSFPLSEILRYLPYSNGCIDFLKDSLTSLETCFCKKSTIGITNPPLSLSKIRNLLENRKEKPFYAISTPRFERIVVYESIPHDCTIAEVYILCEENRPDQYQLSRYGAKTTIHYSTASDFYKTPFYVGMNIRHETINNTAGNLSAQLLTLKKENTNYYIKIEGSINGDDINALREFSETVINAGSFLSKLDLYNCSILKGGDIYYEISNKHGYYPFRTEDNTISKHIFHDFLISNVKKITWTSWYLPNALVLCL